MFADYTDSRQFEKNLAIPRHRNTYNRIQRLPNYNWKPPDKYYGPRYSGKPQSVTALIIQDVHKVPVLVSVMSNVLYTFRLVNNK